MYIHTYVTLVMESEVSMLTSQPQVVLCHSSTFALQRFAVQSATAEEMAYDIPYHPPMMHYWVPSPDSLTNIHTWAHLAPATHMKAGWVRTLPHRV